MATGTELPCAAHDEEAFETWLDFCILRGVLVFYGGGTVGSEQASAAIEDYRRIADCKRADPLVRAYAEHSLCIAYNVTAQFALATERADRAWTRFGASGYGRMMVEIQRGQTAMAQGRVSAARRSYANAMRVAKASYLHEPVWAAIARALLGELEFERNCSAASSQTPGIPAALTRSGTPSQAYAAAADVAVGRVLADVGPESALSLLDGMARYVRGSALTPLARFLAALRVSLLVDAGRSGDAERFWAKAALPGDARACLDLDGQTWREMESLGCAWLRLTIARRRFDEARAFAAELRAAAGTRGLRRTLMRALALCVVLEERAGNPAGAHGPLVEYLALFAETDYARPAIMERRSCVPAVERFLAGAEDSPLRAPAKALLSVMRRAEAVWTLDLSERERDILKRLDGHSDKELAAELGLTTHGVRYHLRRVFSKLGTNRRSDTVRRARELGLIPAKR